MDPLSIIASVAGIVTAAGNVASSLSQVKDAPVSIRTLQTEVDHTKLIFTALRKFLAKTSKLPPQRAALVQLEDVVVILTQTVLVFSELESVVQPLAAWRTGDLGFTRRLNWAFKQTAATRLVNQLQRHKLSLTILLQIF